MTPGRRSCPSAWATLLRKRISARAEGWKRSSQRNNQLQQYGYAPQKIDLHFRDDILSGHGRNQRDPFITVQEMYKRVLEFYAPGGYTYSRETKVANPCLAVMNDWRTTDERASQKRTQENHCVYTGL